MDQMVIEDLTSDINVVRDKLREYDDKIDTLEGRVPKHQRISYDIEEPLNSAVDRSSFGLEDKRQTLNREYRRDSNTGGAIRKRAFGSHIDHRRSSENNSFAQKRNRIEYEEDDDDDASKRPRKTVQSTIIMPALDSKGRDEKIEKLKETENKESKNRNRRMFSNLLMGTLTNFKKTDRKTAQQQKQEEVEKKLEEKRKQEAEARHQEKHELVQKRREQEKELFGLQRKKALIQYADIKINQLKMMKGSIRTTSSPVIYWQPAKHTAGSMELLQQTERHIDDLIRQREDQLKSELEAGAAAENRNNDNSDEEDDEDDERGEDEYETKQQGNSDDDEDIKVVIKDEGDDAENAADEDEVRVELD